LEDRRNVDENSCNSGDGTDQTAPILDVYDDDDDDIYSISPLFLRMNRRKATQEKGQ